MTTQPLLLGLIGDAIDHSLSPRLHEAALQREGLSGSYALLHAPTQGVAQRWLDAVRHGAFAGANVTTPWKLHAARAAEAHLWWSADGWQPGSGPPPFAVNTVWCADSGALTAASTDGPGLVAALQAASSAPALAGSRVVVLGTGGAAQSIVPSLLAAQVDQVVVAGRDLGKALAAAAGAARATEASGLVVRRRSLLPASWRDAAALCDAQLVIHASRVGHGVALDPLTALPANAAAGIDSALTALPWAGWADCGAALADLVYGPAGSVTVAERAAQLAGMPVRIGMGRQMLAAQAALSFQLWTGLPQGLADWQAVLEA